MKIGLGTWPVKYLTDCASVQNVNIKECDDCYRDL